MMHRHWPTRWLTQIAELTAETLGDKRNDAQALVDTLAEFVAEGRRSQKVTHDAMPRHWFARLVTLSLRWRQRRWAKT